MILQERHERVIARAQWPAAGLEAVRARGAWVEAADGRRYLDGTSGMSTVNLGHNRPEVLAAAREQMERVLHTGGVVLSAAAVTLAERLAVVAPGRIASFAFVASGGEAVEAALRLARHARRRPAVVAFRGGFHGRTGAALACSSSRADIRAGCGPLAPGVHLAPFPRPAPGGVDEDAAAEAALRGLDALHRHELAPSDLACYLVEPIQGHGGCHPAGRRFLEGLRERADRHGALLVFDEVQTGFGRTGAWFGATGAGVEPDLICLGKAIANGFPLAALGGRPDLMAGWPPELHGSTFGGNPVSCAAAGAAVEIMAAERVPQLARATGERALAALRAMRADLPRLIDVRGSGLMIGLEIGDPGGAPRPDLAASAVAAAEEEGLLVRRAGTEGNVVRLLPPLTLADWELDLVLVAIRRALEHVHAHARAAQPAPPAPRPEPAPGFATAAALATAAK